MNWMTFPSLGNLPHRLTLRHPSIDVDGERAEVLERLGPWHSEIVGELGYPVAALRTAEQVHGREVAIVDAASPATSAGADGLITNDPSVLLGIYVADCGVIYLADRKTGSIGLVHSGKKGTELGIVAHAIELMSEAFGSQPSDIVAQLGPCIRPPAYEVDFAADLRAQCLQAGIAPANLHDCGVCTSSDPERFYSYRLEKGRTGRMLGLLGQHALA